MFLSVDPLVDTTGQPYLYANGNPTTLSDPSGLDPCGLNGSCGGEYADQKVIYDYNQASHERAAKCDWNCGHRSLAVSSPADWYMPSQNMYMKGDTVAGLFLLGIVACVVACAEIIAGCLAAPTVCATAVQATGAALAPAALAAANGEPVPYNPIGAGVSGAANWINILREGGGASNIAAVTRGGIGPVLQGQAGVEAVVGDLEATGYEIVGREITVDAGGVRTRPDLFVRNPSTGEEFFVEVKSGQYARLTANQKAAFPVIQQQGGAAVGQNAADASLGAFGPMRVVVVYVP